MAKTEDPAGDLLSRPAVDRVATGEASAEEAVGLASLLLVAGHETIARTGMRRIATDDVEVGGATIRGRGRGRRAGLGEPRPGGLCGP
ncbi:MAG TPA: hypothetical protein VFN97_02985 [Actinospica sp.]|nr:hypothetical protein [Actinospica sp.]